MKRRQFVIGAGLCIGAVALPLPVINDSVPALSGGQFWLQLSYTTGIPVEILNGYHIHEDGTMIKVYDPESDLIDWEHEP